MNARQIRIAATGAVITAAIALAPEGVIRTLPEAVGGAVPLIWKIFGAMVVLYVLLCIVRRSGAVPALSAAGGDAASRPPDPRQRPPIPDPPAPYLAHPHILPPHFTGRFDHRQALSDWFRKKRSPAVMAIVGPGGMGKSALAWVWSHRDLLDRDLPQLGQDPPDVRKACRIPGRSGPEGVMWWSFDQPGAGFTVFLDEALGYITGGEVRSSEYLSSRSQKLEALLAHLRDNRLLLILDGFERELQAFSGLAAHYQGDLVEPDQDKAQCACTDLHAAEFLRRLQTQPLAGRVLLTSRLLPAELGDPAAAGPLHRPLGGLDPGDAAALMQSMGVRGEAAEVESWCESVGCHPLTIRLAVGVIKATRESGPIRSAPRPGGEKGRAHRAVVKAAYDALGRDTRRLLSYVAAFRRPVNADQITVINPLGKDAPWPKAMQELVARGLLIFDGETERFDMHPVVRQHAYAQLPDPVALHKQLADYFALVRQPVQMTRLEDLEPLIEHYHHLIGAERYDDACQLLSDKISAPLRDRFANQQMHMRLLRGLYDADGTMPLLKKKGPRAWALSALARAYSYSGETRRAVTLCRENVESFRSKSDRADLLVLLGDLAGVQTRLGCLKDAEATLRRLVDLATELKLRAEEAVARNRLGLLLATRGAFDESLAQLDMAFETTKETTDRQTQGVCFSYYTQRALLMGDPHAALEAAQKARAFVEEIARRSEPDEHDFVRSGWLIGAALVALANEPGENPKARRDEADRYLTDALARCRRADLVGFEPDLLLTWAKWHHLAGKSDKAVEIARDALAVADRCEYRLKQAEIHNFLSQVALKAGRKDEARASAGIAKERALCDGPPNAYMPALEKARKRLAELGDEPQATTKAA